MTKFIKITIAEPFPVLYGHVSYKRGEGPFYAAGSEAHHLYSPAKMAWAETAARMLRQDGYTVSVELT